MHEIFCHKLSIPRIPNYLMKVKQRDFQRTKMATVAHIEYSITKWGSKLFDDDVVNNYLANQSISESMNASSGQMLWQQKLHLAPDRN